MALTCCISSIVCPQQSKDFLSTLEKDSDNAGPAYQALEERISRFHEQSKKVMAQQAATNKIVE